MIFVLFYILSRYNFKNKIQFRKKMCREKYYMNSDYSNL